MSDLLSDTHIVYIHKDLHYCNHSILGGSCCYLQNVYQKDVRETIKIIKKGWNKNMKKQRLEQLTNEMIEINIVE